MSVPPKGIYRFNEIPMKIPTTIFCRKWKNRFSNSYRNCKGPQTAKIILEKKQKAGGLNVLTLKLTTKVNKVVWYWHKDRHIDQWHRTENPEINPHMCNQLIFDKSKRGKGNPFNGAGKTG